MKTKHERVKEIKDIAETVYEHAGTREAVGWLAMRVGSLMLERKGQEKRLKELERRIKKLEDEICAPARLPLNGRRRERVDES